MPQSMIDQKTRGPSGPCHNRRRFERQIQVAQFVFAAEPGSAETRSLFFRVTNPSGKLMVSISVGFSANGQVGIDPLPPAVQGSAGTWDLTPAFFGPNGEVIPMSKVVDSGVISSDGNPTNLPNGWEVETMAPIFLGKVNLNSDAFLSTYQNTSQFDTQPTIPVWVCVCWEDISGSFDPKEIEEIFGGCQLESGGPIAKMLYGP